ncbi:MAG: DUF3575 domain-containing protein [Flavobacteriaceae bacterium]|nr:DUF3575 domain-containing protein [Flavobacteriaceae bacterium]
MKKSILFFLLFGVGLTFAQEINDFEERSKSIQLSPFTWGFGKIGLQYEQQISNHTSLALDFSYKLDGGLSSFPGINSANLKTNDFGFEGVVITPEYRWYFQDQNEIMDGLYLGGYYRFKYLNDQLTGSYTSSITETSSPLDIDASISSHAFGLELGYKWYFKNNFFIDFLIAGPGVSFTRVKLKENQPIPVEFYIDAAELVITNSSLLEMAIDFVNTELEFPSSGANKGKDGMVLPAFRYNISIGYRF